MLQPLEFNAPLLVIFNKVQYPPYVEHCARNAGKIGAGHGVVSQNSRIFESQLAFKRWEGAVELHAACLDKVNDGFVRVLYIIIYGDLTTCMSSTFVL